jgi:hypothetical protein
LDSQNRSNTPGSGQGGGGQRRRRYKGHGNRGPNQGQSQDNQSRGPAENRNRSFQGSNRNRSRGGRVLTSNQVLVKYDNLLEQHLITRKKYYEYFNRVDDRQLYKLEKNFYDSIEHLRRFEETLEPWQREALEKRKTERYKLDLTYSNNRGWNPEEIAKADYQPDENEDPHFKDSQKEAFEEYREDTEESVGTYEDYLKLKGQA